MSRTQIESLLAQVLDPFLRCLDIMWKLEFHHLHRRWFRARRDCVSLRAQFVPAFDIAIWTFCRR